MKTKEFDFRWKKECFIDKSEFEELIKKWELVIKEEYPNEKIKLCNNWVQYMLMDKEDWIIKVSWKEKCMWQYHKYKVHSNLGWFPSVVVAKEYLPAFKGWNWERRYKEVLVDWIDFEENWWSMNLYTNDRNWEWRKMLEDNKFTVIDVD